MAERGGLDGPQALSQTSSRTDWRSNAIETWLAEMDATAYSLGAQIGPMQSSRSGSGSGARGS
jgi:hypothetical protein